MTRNRTDIKIQINSLEAVEHLLGTDQGVRVEVRKAIILEFANRHLAAVADSETIQAAVNRIVEHIQASILEEIQQQTGETIGQIKKIGFFDKKFVLSDQYKKAVAALVKELFESELVAVRTSCHDRISQLETEIKSYIDRRVDSMIEHHIERALYTDFDRRVKEEVDRRLELAQQLKNSQQ